MINVDGKNYKVIVVTPAGRKRYMEILFRYILKNRHIIDSYFIWRNTHEESDIRYFKELSDQYDFVKVKEPKIPINGNWTIHHFFEECVETDTVYIRFDDDIVYVEDDFFIKLLTFRIRNPQYFLVYPNIVNNAIMDHIHQRLGVYNTPEIFNYDAKADAGWGSPGLALYKHEMLLSNIKNNSLKNYKFNRWELFFYERVSINCISWLGEEFMKFFGKVGTDEENWLATDHPRNIRKMNCIYGETMCAHFAFYTQRSFLDATDILNKYRGLNG